MEVVSLVVSIVGFVLTLIGVGIAIYQSRSAKLVAEQANRLIQHVTDFSKAQAHTAKTVGEISIIEAYMAREFSMPIPNMNVIGRQYGALLGRAIELVGGEATLREMVGELNNDGQRRR